MAGYTLQYRISVRFLLVLNFTLFFVFVLVFSISVQETLSQEVVLQQTSTQADSPGIQEIGVANQQTGSNIIVDIGNPCSSRTISIASMQWPSSKILAFIHAKILAEELGCNVEIVPGEMASSALSMASAGEPAIAPEMWIGRIAGIWNSLLESGRVRPEITTFGSAILEGWYLSPRLGEDFPNIRGVADFKIFAQEFRPGGEKMKFISCPADWACSIINDNLLRALELDSIFEIIIPSNRFEMDKLIGEAVSRQQRIAFYYWQPNAILAQFDFLALDMGEFNGDNFKCLAQKNCSDPMPSSFAAEKIFLVAADWVESEVPLVTNYIRRASLPIQEMNLILSWQTEGGLSFEQLAQKFIDERKQVWGRWVEGLM